MFYLKNLHFMCKTHRRLRQRLDGGDLDRLLRLQEIGKHQ